MPARTRADRAGNAPRRPPPSLRPLDPGVARPARRDRPAQCRTAGRLLSLVCLARPPRRPEALSASQVVYVHVNDAPRGSTVERQLDGVRLLPGGSGVIDLTGFLGAPEAIGYDGP